MPEELSSSMTVKTSIVFWKPERLQERWLNNMQGLKLGLKLDYR